MNGIKNQITVFPATTIRGSKLIGSANFKLNLRLIFNVHLLCFKVTREVLAHGAGV